MRARSLVVCLTLVASAAAFPRAARAQQVSDSDRAAARDLYFEGVRFQDSGKFADGLDRFDRAQRIFSAPTHLLHIAECQAALGRLVESAESYRALIRTPLPQGSPQAFQLAQQQAAAELPQVEPRIPQVKIDVSPANAANLQVQVDGLTMNPALVGVSRPIDPGPHKLVVFAPGYGKQEQTFSLKERENKLVPVVLVATSGIVYGPAIPVAPQPAPYQAVPQAPQPATEPPPADAWKPQPKPPSSSFVGGLRVGALFPTGSAFSNSSTSIISNDTTAMSNLASAGGGFGLEAGLRFASHFLIGGSFEHGFYGKGDTPPVVSSTTDVQQSVSSNYLGTNLAYISNPEGFGFYGEIGIGYRWFSISTTGGGIDASDTLKGAEFELGAGAWIRAGNVRLIPKVSFNAGSFTKHDLSCSGTGCTASSNSTDSTVPNTAMHTFVFLGLGGYYNIDFGK